MDSLIGAPDGAKRKPPVCCWRPMSHPYYHIRNA
nr:MAG TPA: hypothetical protein [Caudoviricetes sp.]DAG11785.1 MAG TPA: hypothetical protein [Caudoviricetes sp.]DAI62199.1 MAG TPA: hypothetical protein [Caudoviricetes sp.]DAM39877.1 MAG TPA: hypothetical protein [Caudoviricetes sp.]DAU10523.1 MAG TPA: hypothetical protein [Caudoviricetes sp.]